MVKAFAALLFALSPLASALEGPVTVSAARFSESVSAVDHLLHTGASDASVKLANDDLADEFPRVTPGVKPDLRGWDHEPVSGDISDISAIMTESKKRLLDRGVVPPANLTQAVDLASAIKRDERLILDETLDENEMGMFRFKNGNVGQGTIGLNVFLQYIGMKVGHAFAAATLFHELGHAGDKDLAGKGTIDGEVPALTLAYDWLVWIDPYGERLALLRAVLAKELRLEPNRLTKMALDYATSLDVLRGTKGDERSIRRYAHELGYRDGDDHRHQ